MLRSLLGWLAAALVVSMRWTSTVRFHRDPRPALRAGGTPYAYAFLHAHQLATVIAGEPGTGAMVSRSPDGDLLVPSLRAGGIRPIRGSTRKGDRDKGGRAALALLIEHSRSGAPAYFAVDGPRGPRRHVGRGVAELALATGAAILPAAAIPARRWILPRTWDRFQIPQPFTRIDVFFADPIRPESADDVDGLRERVGAALRQLEEEHDPREAGAAQKR